MSGPENFPTYIYLTKKCVEKKNKQIKEEQTGEGYNTICQRQPVFQL